MATARGIIVSSLNIFQKSWNTYNVFQYTGPICQVRHFAARRGTREKARRKKVKKEVKKLTFAEKIALTKKVIKLVPDVFDEDEKKVPIVDDVYFMAEFQEKIYTFAEAVQSFKELCDPSIHDLPNSLIHMKAELNLTAVKKTKAIDQFTRSFTPKHVFNHGEERSVLALSKNEEDVEIALKAGAARAGGVDVIKKIQSGDISLHNYNVYIAHPNILPELLVVKGLMKRKFPSLKDRSLGPDFELMIQFHLNSIKFYGKPYPDQKFHGYVQTPIGPVDMEHEKLEDNLRYAVEEIMKQKPKRAGEFITRIKLLCPPLEEKSKIDHKLYVPQENVEKDKKEEEEAESDGEEDFAVPVSN